MLHCTNSFSPSHLHRYHAVYDSLYNLAMAEDSINPEKYRVEGYPPMHAFPEFHPNRVNPVGNKDEL